MAVTVAVTPHPVPAPALPVLNFDRDGLPIPTPLFPQDENFHAVFLSQMEALNASNDLVPHLTLLSKLHSVHQYSHQGEDISTLETKIERIKSGLNRHDLIDQINIINETPHLKKNKHIKEHLEKFKYLSKDLCCKSCGCACFCGTRLSHHLSKRLGTCYTTSKAANYLLAGFTLMSFSSIGAWSNIPGFVFGLALGSMLVFAPCIDSCYSACSRNP